MAKIETFKTHLIFADYGNGHPYLTDTIWYQNAWWLVSSTWRHIATGDRVPERLVRLTGLQFQEVKNEPYRFLLNTPMPKSVFDGKPQGGYVLGEFPTLAHMDDTPPTLQ